MPEAFFNGTEGSGKKIHHFQRTIGANDVLDEVVQSGEQYLASYSVGTGLSGTLLTTNNDHQMQIMAGSTLNVYIRRIFAYQVVLATTAAIAQFQVLRLTTAGTGGTAVTPQKNDESDSASGASIMTLPTVKGTEGGRMWSGGCLLAQTAPTAGASTLLFDIDTGRFGRLKDWRLSAGTTNGFAVKNVTANPAAAIVVNIWYSEANF